MLQIIATARTGNLVDNEARGLGNKTPRHGDQAVIGKPIGLAGADIHQPALADVQDTVIRTRDGLELANEAEPAQNLHLLAGDLFDAEFFREHGALVDYDEEMDGAREHRPRHRSSKPTAHYRNARHHRVILNTRATLR